MTSVRSNLNNVSNGCDGNLTAFKNLITTCRKYWFQKVATGEEQERAIQKITLNDHRKNYFCNIKINQQLHDFQNTLKRLFSPISKYTNNQRPLGDQGSFEKIEIISKLLSSTLIPTQATVPARSAASDTVITTNTEETQWVTARDIEVISSEMTIAEETFVRIRDENPDLDAEVRSILTARAQTGATIGEIKKDYRKYMGTCFPVYDNITDFLLCIPGVSVYCNDRGTRIFNIRPMKKTEHIYDLVTKQRTQDERDGSKNFYKNRYQTDIHDWRDWRNRRDSGINSLQSNIAPISSGSNGSNERTSGHSSQTTWTSDFQIPQTQQQRQQQKPVEPVESAMHQQQTRPLVQIYNYRNEMDGYMDQMSGYYQDNCEYLLNRIYKNQDFPPLEGLPYINRNNNSDYTINHNYHSSYYNNQNTAENHYQQIPKNLNLEQNTQIAIAQPSPNNNPSDRDSAIFKRPSGRPASRSTRRALSPAISHIPTSQPSPINNPGDCDNSLFKRPLGRPALRSAIHASSPAISQSSLYTESIKSTEMDYEAYLLDFPLLGDDFFLYFARMELKCKFKKHQKILQSGLCVSGQTITSAIRRARRLPYKNRRMIINIGSADIMQGKSLVQIEHEYRQLINTLVKRQITPILTTLAPLANYAHDQTIKTKLERFNEFIKREEANFLVVDIWARFVNERKQTLFDCYQNEPRRVTGAIEPYVFWNKIGRQRVLQTILSKLEY